MKFLEALGISGLGFAIVFVALIALMAVVWLMAKILQDKNPPVAAPTGEAVTPDISPEPTGATVVLGGFGHLGDLELIDCDEKTTAIVIAVVADMLGDDFAGKQVTRIKLIGSEG